MLRSSIIVGAGAKSIQPNCMMGRQEPEGILRLPFTLQKKMRPEQCSRSHRKPLSLGEEPGSCLPLPAWVFPHPDAGAPDMAAISCVLEDTGEVDVDTQSSSHCLTVLPPETVSPVKVNDRRWTGHSQGFWKQPRPIASLPPYEEMRRGDQHRMQMSSDWEVVWGQGPRANRGGQRASATSGAISLETGWMRWEP